ncbi:MAG: SHOCT domain-containing protein [Pleomorphochaeta sp.]
MENKAFENQKKYNSSLYLFKNLKETKLISTKEYNKANKLLIKKYKPMIQS